METRPPSRNRIGEPDARDAAVGDWPRQTLIAMDRRFATRLEKAIEAGREHLPEERKERQG